MNPGHRTPTHQGTPTAAGGPRVEPAPETVAATRAVAFKTMWATGRPTTTFAIAALRAGTRAEIEAAIREFGLVPWAHSLAGSLSGGWERRLQLAASLLHSPQLVLLDEPTAGLDVAARQEYGGMWKGWRLPARV